MSEETPPRNPSYRLHRPSGQAVVTVNGRDHYLGRHGTAASRQAYDRLIGEWLAQGRQLLNLDARDVLTVTEVIAAYWRHAKEFYRKEGRPTGELAKVRFAQRVLRRLYGRTKASEFGPLALKTVRQAFVDAGNSRRTVNDQVGRIKRMFRWATENELVPPSLFHGLQAVAGLRRGRSVAREPIPVKPVPDAHVEAVQQYVSKQVWAMIQLQQFTGMRPGEVAMMRRCDVDTSGDIWLYRPASHKTEHFGHERTVDIGPKAQAVIRPFLRAEFTGYLFSPAVAIADYNAERRRERQTPMTPSQRARRPKRKPKRRPRDHYDRDSYRRAIARACDLAKVPHWHPHQLRHNYATRIRKEFGVEAARILLGHRSTAVTELYAEIDRGRVREIVSKVG